MNNYGISNFLHEQYNEEPVFYCKKCLSLRIREIEDIRNSEYCDDCGSAEIGQCNIKEWEELYKAKYGHYYINKN
jgi:hypothetical protein